MLNELQTIGYVLFALGTSLISIGLLSKHVILQIKRNELEFEQQLQPHLVLISPPRACPPDKRPQNLQRQREEDCAQEVETAV
jgi:hypothetical protein